MIDSNFSEEELKNISKVTKDMLMKVAEDTGEFHKNIDAALEFGIKSALEEKGYTFKSDYEFLKFCITEMKLYTEVKTGDPFNKRYVAKLRGSEEELFSLPVSLEIDFSNSRARLSALRCKLSKQSGEEIEKQASELRNEWERNVDE